MLPVAGAGLEGPSPGSPIVGFSEIPSFWMPVITKLLMVILENVFPVAAGSWNFDEGRWIPT